MGCLQSARSSPKALPLGKAQAETRAMVRPAPAGRYSTFVADGRMPTGGSGLGSAAAHRGFFAKTARQRGLR